MKNSLSEILKIVSEGKTATDRAKLLKKYESDALKFVLVLAMDQHHFTWGLPKGWVPKYTPCQYFGQEGMLYSELKRIGKFLVPGTYPNMSQEKRMKLFVQLLESVTPGDAELLLAIKDRRLPYQGIYRSIINMAFPDLLPPARMKEGETEEEHG